MNILEFYDYKKQDDLVLLHHIIKWIEIEKYDINQYLGKETHFTLLMVCSYFHKYECVKWLLEHDANPSLKSSNGHTAFTFLASSPEISKNLESWHQHLSIVQLFTKFNVNFNQTGYDNITPLEELLNSNNNIPENVFLHYLKYTSLEQSTQPIEHQFDIFSTILFQPREDITHHIIDYILNENQYDINYQFPVSSYEHNNKIINELISNNFASSVSLLNNEEFKYHKNILTYIHSKHFINYNILDEDQKPIIINTIKDKNILTMRFMLEKEPSLLHINYENKNILQLCVEYNFVKGFSYFLKQPSFSKENIQQLLPYAKTNEMIGIINNINSSYLKNNLEQELNFSSPNKKQHKL